MPVLRWSSRLVVPARTLDGDTTQVVIGVLETNDGPKRAVLVGHGTDAALLRRQAVAELIHNARTMMIQNIPEDRT